jgi:hypothetical protein
MLMLAWYSQTTLDAEWLPFSVLFLFVTHIQVQGAVESTVPEGSRFHPRPNFSVTDLISFLLHLFKVTCNPP